MYTLVSISTPITMLATYSKIIAMSFQGKDFTPAMKQLVINLKRHFDEERKHYKEDIDQKSHIAHSPGPGYWGNHGKEDYG